MKEYDERKKNAPEPGLTGGVKVVETPDGDRYEVRPGILPKRRKSNE